ncbi:type II toxin-antitoxin system Phd/YefM family antitoxin [Rhizobium sp. HT1-10]|uniref:type II toxin-antitoxin system Phd/YefM family antitoxin n=1 Tax=Rhizobium sp. HT1-10 TaxID=3111638 RepID=UPI003C23BDBA
MAHVGFTDFRQNLATHLDDVVNSRAPLVVTRRQGKAVVVISEEEYDAMQETLHLLGNPVNAELLRGSIAELEAGEGAGHDLIENGS